MDYRQKCFSQKEERCDICGDTESIHVHHIDGDRSNDSIENLAPLCNSCHSSVHMGAKGFEEWTQKLKAKRDRKRTVTLTLSQDLSRQVEVVRQTCSAESDPDAVRFAIKERAETVSNMDEVFTRLDELRRDPGETDAEVILRLLQFRQEIEGKLDALIDEAVEERSLPYMRIAELIYTEELPFVVKNRRQIGRNGSLDTSCSRPSGGDA